MDNQDNNIGNVFALRPRARIMRTLGNELISNNMVAVIELVKNAYDADASRVLIRFISPLELGKGSIEVIDNGSGMTLDVVRRAWMEPATPNKRLEKKSKRFDRRVLGEKGIGRFAAMRLSEQLEMFTRTKNSINEVYGFFDWSQFDDPDKYLDEILLLTEERSPIEICANGGINDLQWQEAPPLNSEDLSSGTLLRMKNLKHSWEKEDFADLQRGLARLISPFFDNQNFQIKLEAPEPFFHYSDLIEPPSIVQHPHYSVKGTVEANGKCNISFTLHTNGTSKTLNGGFIRTKDFKLQNVDEDTFSRNLEEKAKLQTNNSQFLDNIQEPQCGLLSVELRIWDRDELGNLVQATKSTLQDVRKDLDAIAGINIYRDGFRVLPYGEPKNDWLRLDIRRVQKPAVRLSNNQIVGYIAITADGNPNLTDQSNREGLNENIGYFDLKDIMLTILNEIENLRRDARKKEANKESKESASRSLFAPLDFGGIRAHLASKYPSDTKANEFITDVENKFTKQLESIKSVVSRYHSLATLGQLIDVLLHDGRQPISSIASQSLLGQEDINDVGQNSNSLFPSLFKRFSIIHNQVDILRTAFRRIEPFGGRKKGRPSQLYLENIVETAFEIFSSQLKEAGITVEMPITKTLVRLDPSEFQEVLINLLQNSIYWLQFVDKSTRKIAVSVTRTADDCVEVIFGDSGPGVPEEHRASIFEPYFSTKPDGIGLGLAIAGEIITDYYGGKLELMDNSKLGGAVFKITLRKRV